MSRTVPTLEVAAADGNAATCPTLSLNGLVGTAEPFSNRLVAAADGNAATWLLVVTGKLFLGTLRCTFYFSKDKDYFCKVWYYW